MVNFLAFFATSLNRKGVIKMTRNTKTNTIVIVTAIATLLSATATFADTKSSNSVQAPKLSQIQSAETNYWFKSCLDGLVKDGTITKVKEDAIHGAVTIANENAKANDFQSVNSGFKTVMDRLVKDGTIIKAQEEAIQSAVIIANQDAAANYDFQSVDNCGSKYVMDSLVIDGTITKAQEVAIQNAVTTAKEDGTITYAQEVDIQGS